MPKIYPSWSSASLTHPSSLNHISSQRENFTIWMRSLVLNGNGCTVYDSKGRIVYRVDNYDFKCPREVYLMDFSGKPLFKILKKRLGVFGRWEGYNYNEWQKENATPCFKVKKQPCRVMLKASQTSSCQVCDDTGRVLCCKITGSTSTKSFHIVGFSDELLAEVKRKETTSGVGLGDDVLSLVVEPNIDQSLIMALVVVHGLMNCTM